ncbi:ribokinase [Thermosporothrix hazakensis]|uniref:Ribokinase n=2 Tax=Thermosporothrix TaxID=768650 RepID=A0A326U8Z8_THEHA|nr:PfkB family carbohydrate kinase [Thermosporothrix hazakensis]PZW30522.1 ribokinase [Thermosporothrix hazakensis]BBH91237.1 ribokinase [Thermosporothrix sp. COM3]GCE49383.1 ribokinase [Thermosporothrix hazakensis]
MADPEIVVVGGAYTDCMVRGSRLPAQGETVVGRTMLELPGGKGANQAVAAARLGGNVAFIGKIGNDPRGDAIAEAFLREGVDIRYLWRSSQEPTGMCLVMEDERDKRLMMLGLAAAHALTIADVRNAASLIRSAKIVMVQLEVSVEVVAEVMQLGWSAGAKIFFDPSPPLIFPDGLLRLVEVMKPDALEARAITGCKVTDQQTAREAAQKLLTKGVKLVAIEAGNKGNLLVWKHGEHWLPRLPVQICDRIGAGDAFAGALAVAFAEGQGMIEAGNFASTAAALTTTRIGARTALPTRRDVEEMMVQAFR